MSKKLMQEGVKALREQFNTAAIARGAKNIARGAKKFGKGPDAFFGIRKGSHNSLGVPRPDMKRIHSFGRIQGMQRNKVAKPTAPTKLNPKEVNYSSMLSHIDQTSFDDDAYVHTNQGVLSGGLSGLNFRDIPDERGIGPFGNISNRGFITKSDAGTMGDLPFDSPYSKKIWQRVTGRRGSF
jgi:hypothetical protein